jgi:septum formation protein
MKRIILASTSKYRASLLRRLGLDFDQVAPQVNERQVEAQLLATGITPLALCEELARQKCRSVAQFHPDAWVIGSDQLLEIDGQVLGKPGTDENARAQLGRLSGRTHRLITAMCLRLGSSERIGVVTAHLQMRHLSPSDIAAYVALDQPVDCAGSYKLEKHGIGLMETIACEDWTSIEGLPLLRLRRALAELGALS